jgi:hypothetical protein
MMQIQIQETHPAAPGKKMAAVVATGGQRYSVWPEMLSSLLIGGTFEVQVESWESSGRTLQKIEKATPVNGAAPTGNGAAKTNGHASAPAAPAGSTGEAEFVGRALHALILKGEVPYTKRALYDATELLRGLYGATFGGRGNGTGGGDA